MSLLSELGFQQSFTSITADSRQVVPGALFLAYPGVQSDGRNYIEQAISAGASAVLWEKVGFSWPKNYAISNVGVDDLKQQTGLIAADFYGKPSQKLTVIGVTGTNGKTSVSLWLAHCLSLLGQKTAVLGTIGNGIVATSNTPLATSTNTTPDAILLQAMLADYVMQNAKMVVMEVSSHGLDQGRVNEVDFDIAVLTNLSRDHLDYHQSMEAYADAKQALFAWPSLACAVVNADDTLGQKIAAKLKAQHKTLLSYGLQAGDVRASDLQLQQKGISMRVSTSEGVAQLSAPVLGRFNAYNLLAVLTTLLSLDIPLAKAVSAIEKIKPVPGRMQQLGGAELPLVVIDYAHTPDALEKVLATLREQIEPNSKIICVFGCGGERDAGKRPLMGAIAKKFADEIIVTADNPRNEDSASIVNQIVTGLNGLYRVELDRAKAIHLGVATAHAGDIVLVAGKGHEDYQEIAGVKLPFSDVAVAQIALGKYKPASALGALQ